MLHNTMALVFSGSTSQSLDILSHKRAISAIPFGGRYRLIDFSLSNLSNSDVRRIGVLTQFRPSSLIEHINFGKPWDLVARDREVKILPPYSIEENSNWYKGTVDAVYQNLDFINMYSPKDVCLVAGENIYDIDFTDVLDFHHKKNADVTLVVKNILSKDFSRFGVVEFENDFKIKSFEEKPISPKSDFVFLSICIFNKDILLNEVIKDSENKNSTHYFNRDIFPNIINKYNIYAYIHNGPWFYNGTIEEYWQNNMNMLSINPTINPEKWGIRSNPDDRETRDRGPSHIKSGKINNSIISRGCIIEGKVINSILFPGVKISKNTIIKDSIIMHDTKIKSNVSIEKAIIDKDVEISEKSIIGFGENVPNTEYPEFYNTGITVISKKVKIPKASIIGKNCLVYSNIKSELKKNLNIKSGISV